MLNWRWPRKRYQAAPPDAGVAPPYSPRHDRRMRRRRPDRVVSSIPDPTRGGWQ